MFNQSQYFNTHTVLFREGDSADKLIIVKTGQVLCLKASKERLIPVFVAKAQDIIGESALLSDAPYTYSAVTLTQVEVECIDNSKFTKVLAEAPHWMLDLTLTMIARFQSTAGLVADNRIVHSSVLSEEDFPPTLENELKKLLAQ